jgi:ABC-type nitrate/sulfonate/bicarbonate transport system permease component
VISLVSFLLLWGTVSLLLNEPTLLPTPWEVFIGFFNLIKDGQLLTDIQASLQRVFIGFFIASCLAVPLGIILAYFYIPRQILLPIITILRPIPPIAWIPLAILWFGIGDSSSYFITALAAFFPIFINSFAGEKPLSINISTQRNV